MIRCLVLLLLVLVLPARANLGESIQQCVARYGKPVHYTEANDKLPFGTVVFAAEGYELIVFVLGDKEVGARVSKLDKSAFTEAERQTIMAADSGSGWVSVRSSDPTCLEWARSDQATALYDQTKNMLMITSPEMAAALHPAAAK